MAVECYEEKRDIWNDRIAMLIEKLSLGRMSRSSEFFFTICSLRLFKGVEFSNLYPLRF